ncbi:MAG: DEAD/DEAH box helicase family protein [Methanobrevibacter wolinii]
MDYNKNIIDGAKTAFIDEKYQSYEEFKPEFIINKKGEKVLNSIKEELEKCDEFYISVAFITMGGLTPLLQDLKELEERGIKGKVLTTDYLNFTEPKALRKLNEFKNIEVKLYAEESEGFHTKGYIFKQGTIYQAIVGSSNLTMNALTINKEWNIGFSSLNNGEILNNIIDEFKSLWDKSKDVDDIIDEYESIYNHYKNFTKFNREITEIKKENIEEIKPNIMQEKFLKNIRELIKKGEDKALLVSATGTGKTYAAAFAVYDFRPKRFLFLVHREQIAKQAIKTFKKVFKNENNKFGLLSGNSKEYNKDYLFSTIQTMSKEEVYRGFKKDSFDYIVIDEVHKAGANSYLKILNYFKPKFILGMSASPDRTDNFNIYELFDYNLPLDIRLQDALDEDLLCPFHYFGISDLEINGISREDTSDFNFLVSNDRVNYLIEKSNYYGYSGNRRKALGFCSTKKEAEELAKEFTKRGYPSLSLTGANTQEEREEAINRLTNDNYHDKIEFIFTVDIFNEGVDIPEANQILLIRPTQSSIIFIQQLGRGLRKYKNKEYVVIIDFIGNYKNNFLIPIALSGDRTYDKDNIRKYIIE